MSATSLRVGIVGARRLRQGLGPFIARDFKRAGHRVVAVLGRTADSAAAAADGVAERTGERPTPFHGRTAFLAAGLDAVVVATPAGAHLEEVRAALRAGKHVLAEKPLLWHPETEWESTVRGLEDEAAERGLVLAANAQWPWTLDAWAELFGLDPLVDPRASAEGGARSLRMGLAPASVGRQMIGDALPHPLSVAQALAPGLLDAEDVRFDGATDGSEECVVRARLTGSGAALDLEVVLEGASADLPRRAWLEIDGHRAERCVRVRDYALSLRSGARLVDLPDPLTARVGAFARDVLAAPRGAEPDRTLSRRARMLAAIDRAWGPGERPQAVSSPTA